MVFKEHDDKSKFLAQAGFHLDKPKVLEDAIRQLISNEEATYDRSNEYGDYYNVEGELIGTDGNVMVVTIWLTQPDKNSPFRFVTLKPGKKRK